MSHSTNPSSHYIDSQQPSLNDLLKRKDREVHSWTMDHISAFHVDQHTNVELSKAVPLEYCDKEMLLKMQFFWLMTKEDVYQRDETKLGEYMASHEYTKCIGSIIYILHNLENLVEMETIPTVGGPYDEKDELFDKYADRLGYCICTSILKCLEELVTDKTPPWDIPSDSVFDITVRHSRFCEVYFEEMLVYHSSKDAPGLPYIWLDYKPRKFAPGTKDYQRTFPIKAAKTIAMGAYNPRVVFGIELSSFYAAFWRADISDKYYEYLQAGTELPPKCRIDMKGSKAFDLTEPEGRKGFAQAFIALLLYVDSLVTSE